MMNSADMHNDVGMLTRREVADWPIITCTTRRSASSRLAHGTGANFSVAEMKAMGRTAIELKAANFTVAELAGTSAFRQTPACNDNMMVMRSIAGYGKGSPCNA